MGRRSTALAGALVAVAVLAGGCVGVTDRDEFDAMIDARGGGATSDLGLEAIAAVAERIGAEDLEMTQLTINPGGRIVVIEARDPGERQNLDRWIYRSRGGLDDPEPVQVSAADDLDARTFRASQLPALARVEELSDATFAALELDAASVESIVGTVVQGSPILLLSVESPRARGAARFTGDGTLLEAARS